MNFIRPAANKSILRFYYFCMTLVLHFMPFMMKLMVQQTGDTFPTLTDLDYLTKHITLKLFPFLRLKGMHLYYFLLVYLPE